MLALPRRATLGLLALAGFVALALAAPRGTAATGPQGLFSLLQLAGVAGALGLGAWTWWRAPARAQAPARLAVVSRAQLSPQHHVALIEADGARLLIAFGPHSTQVHPLPPEVKS
jgi:flagellar biogenesis protein FliO